MPGRGQAETVKALSPKQERRLRDFIDERLLDISRNFRKRSELTSTLATLPLYLTATRQILSIILQIPPVDPSSSLRTAFLLKLTNDALGAITGYFPRTQDLPELLDWLEDIDNAWLVVLRRQAWDPPTSIHEDGWSESEHSVSEEDSVEMALPQGEQSSPITQTERTRLRSLLVAAEERLEEWLTKLDTATPAADGQEQDLGSMLETMGLQQRFDDLFIGTMAELGDLHGIVIESGEEVSVSVC